MNRVRDCVQLDLRIDPGSEGINGVRWEVHDRGCSVESFVLEVTPEDEGEERNAE